VASGGHGGGHKRHEEHEEHEEHVNHEAWVIPYADMLTLLMVMFLALFATGRVDMEKFKKLAENLKQDFGGSAEIVSLEGGGSGSLGLEGGAGIFTGALAPTVGGEPTQMQIEQARQQYEKAAAGEALEDLQGFEQTLTGKATIAGFSDNLLVSLEGRGMLVTVLSDEVLFRPGSAALEPAGFTVLGVVAEALRTIPNSIIIEGHTDARPISNNRFQSNWELSTARATTVLQFFLSAGVSPERLAASGYGETQPVAGNETPEGQAKNRRVEIVVLTDVSLEPILDDPGAADVPAAPAVEAAPGGAGQ
jgi:chemotaxis protein MotB